MKTLYLIDGYAQFFRAYHAIRSPMSSPVTGEPTNMTFGFVGMLLKLLREEGSIGEGGNHADYLAVALDVSGDKGTFRSQIYPEYKATRPEPPEDLEPQVDRCLGMLETIGVPVLGAEGFEADDVIATLATRLTRDLADLRIRIISKDKDLKQILSDRVELYDIHKDESYTAQRLREELGITPDQVIDVLALMGDSADNIPGVEGIGEKTAAKLIAQYGSLDDLLAHADEIRGKRGEKIRAADGRLLLNRELVTLRTDLDLSLDLPDADRRHLRLSELEPILRELGFNRFRDELRTLLGDAAPDAASSPPIGGLFEQQTLDSPAMHADYRAITTLDDLDAFLERVRQTGFVAIDTETTSLRPVQADLCGVSLSVEEGTGVYIPVRSPDPASHLDEATVIERLRPVLEDPDIAKVGHNLKYDLIVLRRCGIRLRGHDNPSEADAGSTLRGDTLIASFLLDPLRSSHSLDALALALLDYSTMPIRDLIGSGKEQRTFDQVPLDLATPYASEDADISLRLARRLIPQVEREDLARLWREVELPLVDVLASLEFNGILVDPEELQRQEARLRGQIDELRERIREVAIEEAGRAFDPDSPKQLAGILFNKPDHDEPGLGLRPLKRGKTGPSTDAEVLEKLSLDESVQTRLPELILEYRQLTKLVNTYLVNLRECINEQTGRIHASFHQTGAATGRLSSSDPNLQNIPIRTPIGREIRRAFIAPPGRVLISADYSQIELRLLAHLSQDAGLIEAFKSGEDIHRAVAARIHRIPIDEVTPEQRSGAKMVNFGIVYGITPFGLARRLNISTSEAQEIIDDYKRRFRGITTFLHECVEQARTHGFVQTMLGRRRPVPEIESTNPARKALAERIAINSVVQGSAADLIKQAMVDLHPHLDWRDTLGEESAPPDPEHLSGVMMLLQIHDELVFEAPQESGGHARDVIVQTMESAMRLRVPLVVDAHISQTWYEGK